MGQDLDQCVDGDDTLKELKASLISIITDSKNLHDNAASEIESCGDDMNCRIQTAVKIFNQGVDIFRRVVDLDHKMRELHLSQPTKDCFVTSLQKAADSVRQCLHF